MNRHTNLAQAVNEDTDVKSSVECQHYMIFHKIADYRQSAKIQSWRIHMNDSLKFAQITIHSNKENNIN